MKIKMIDSYVVGLLIWIASISLAAGVTAGIYWQRYESHRYVGVVVAKEYLPARTVNNELYDSEYFVIVRDQYGDKMRYRVSRAEYKQIEIKDMYKR